MIPISLPNGKITFITLEESLEDDFMEKLIAKDEGYESNNPFDKEINSKFGDMESTIEPENLELSKKDIKKIQKEIEEDGK